MNKNLHPRRNSYLQLHLAVLLFGFTAILGELIRLDALSLVWWRLLLTCLSIPLIYRGLNVVKSVPHRDLRIMMFTGVLVAAHWVTFFASVKLANASVALICYSTTALFTALLQPFFGHGRIKLYEILLAALVIPGMILVTRGVESGMLAGIVIGLVSALLIALFTLFNKDLVQRYDPMLLTFTELGTGGLVIGLVLLGITFTQGQVVHFIPHGLDWLYLLILALLCTTLGYVLQLRALKKLSAFTANLSMNLEPVYGIILGIVLLQHHQQLGTSFYLGVILIILAIFAYPILHRKR